MLGMRSPTYIACACLFMLTALVGCQSTPGSDHQAAREDASFTFHPDQYPVVHEAIVEVLRDDFGFRIARNDYRFGTVTTFPKESPTFAEFWIDDATTRDQRAGDTLNSHQRTLAVKVKPNISQYTLTVEAMVERLQQPNRYLTHSVTGRITAFYTATPTYLRDRGIEGAYAQSLTRDPDLAARIAEAIEAKARGQIEKGVPAPTAE